MKKINLFIKEIIKHMKTEHNIKLKKIINCLYKVRYIFLDEKIIYKILYKFVI